jgi:hypothetical protein
MKMPMTAPMSWPKSAGLACGSAGLGATKAIGAPLAVRDVVTISVLVPLPVLGFAYTVGTNMLSIVSTTRKPLFPFETDALATLSDWVATMWGPRPIARLPFGPASTTGGALVAAYKAFGVTRAAETGALSERDLSAVASSVVPMMLVPPAASMPAASAAATVVVIMVSFPNEMFDDVN